MNAAVKELEIQENHETEDNVMEIVSRSQAVVELDLDGNILKVNDIFLKSMGYKKDEVEGENHRILCEEIYINSLDYKNFWEKLKLGEFCSGEYKRYSKKGKEVWFMGSYNPIAGKDGKPYKVLLLAADVTATKEELKVRTDIMNVTSIVSESNLKGDILSINEKFIEVSKYPRDELIGFPHNTTRHPDMPKEVFKEMWGTIGRGKMFRGIIKNRAKDGTPYYVDAVVAPILGPNGRPKKYLGVRYDITETEIERQNMKGVLNAIDRAFAYIEFDTNGNFETCNDNFISAMGYSKEELVGRHHSSFCDKEFVESEDYKKLWQDLKGGENKSGVFKRLKKDGTVIWLQAVYAPVADETGRVIKVIKIATDVTEQQTMLTAIQETAVSLASASTELTATASQMSTTSDKTSEQADAASSVAGEVATGVQIVATNIEEMVASIKEISRSTSESSHMAKTTLEKAQESNLTVTKLGSSSQEIGDVIKVISSIAQQTNLLALNATIEAARAGEAGKGFAVVANEVKELAKQTAKATDDITHRIGAIQSDTQSAIDAIADISEAIEKLNSISGVIAASVEEQTATTNEISRVVIDSKKGVENIADSIKHVSIAAGESSASSGQTLTASRELAQLAERLTKLSQKGGGVVH